MPHGTGSTLTIKPRAAHLADISIGLSGGEPYDDTSDYICPLQTLDFNEELRRQIIYGQAPPGEGGRAVVDFGPLVPVVFNLVIKTQTREEMIAAFDALQATLVDPEGGTILYKPEDLAGGVLSTYYHYLQSPPPRLLDEKGNRWDASPKSDDYYTLQIMVEFTTQPVATSDPDNPVTLSELATTVENWIDDSPSQDNGVTITAANLKGSLPALLRIMARPGAGQDMARLLVFDRKGSSLSGNFVCILEAEDASLIDPSISWSEVADGSRGDGNYMECNPSQDANGEEQGLRFTITAPAYYRGRFAVLGIGKDEAVQDQIWTHQVKIRAGNVMQSGETWYFAEYRDFWAIVYAGEFDFPPTAESAVETAYHEGPYIEWYSTRASGSSKFSLDAILLFFVADENLLPSGIDFICSDEGGVTNDEKLLVENFTGVQGIVTEIAHVIAQSDEDFKRVLRTAPRGDFITLDPLQDHLLTFVQERFNGVILDDDFSGYKGSRWKLIEDFESTTGWTFSDASRSGDNNVEGSYTFLFDAALEAFCYKTVDLDLETEARLTATDYVVIALYLTAAPSGRTFSVRLSTTVGADYYYYTFSSLSSGWNLLYIRKNQFSSVGSPDWSSIVRLRFDGTASGPNMYADYFRIEKADPDDANSPNVTGEVWDFQPAAGGWTITEDISGAGSTLACLDIESGVEKCAEITATTSDDVRLRAKVLVNDASSGYVGIIWRASDITSGSEDLYTAILDLGGDDLIVREYTAGSATPLESVSFTCAGDTWYTIGVIVKGSTHKIYATASSNLSAQDDIFSNDYLVATVSDATHTSGQAGVMSISVSSRFDELQLENIQDRVIPADTVTLEGKAIFRTIAPFHE